MSRICDNTNKLNNVEATTKRKIISTGSISLKYVLAGIAILSLAIYIFVAISRISYPYELEWMEGGSVDHVRKILAGDQLYIEPSLEFTPYIYPPFYFYVASFVSWLIGIGLFPLRLVSFLSSIGCFLIIYHFVNRETGRCYYGLMGAALFAATFKIGGAWFDIARVDTLFLLLLLASIFLVWFKPTPSYLLIAGLLISLSFLTKQSALLVAIGVSIYCIFAIKGRSRFIFPVTVILVGVLSTVLLNWYSGGWYFYYVFYVPTRHPLINSVFLSFWTDDLVGRMSIALVISSAFLLYQLLVGRYKALFFFGLLFLSMIGTSWFSRLHSGGYDNVLLPAYAIIALLFGMGIPILLDNVDKKSRFMELVILMLCITQYAMLVYNPISQIPTKADIEAGDELVRLMQGIEGEVYMPNHGYIPVLAGKTTYSQTMALFDIIRTGDEDMKNKLQDEINEAIANKSFGAIILDYDIDYLINEINKNYEYQGIIFDSDSVFWPLTGMLTRQQKLFTVCRVDCGLNSPK